LPEYRYEVGLEARLETWQGESNELACLLGAQVIEQADQFVPIELAGEVARRDDFVTTPTKARAAVS
jgi:hypothetical protein